jgi:hypothetical protein
LRISRSAAVLRGLQRLVDGVLARERRAHLLAHRDADRLELGIAANCTPTYGLFGSVLSFGLARVDRLLLGSANFAAFRNSAFA